MIIRTPDGGIAEIILDHDKRVPNAMDVARTLLTGGVTAAKIIKSNRKPGEPETKSPIQAREYF